MSAAFSAPTASPRNKLEPLYTAVASEVEKRRYGVLPAVSEKEVGVNEKVEWLAALPREKKMLDTFAMSSRVEVDERKTAR